MNLKFKFFILILTHKNFMKMYPSTTLLKWVSENNLFATSALWLENELAFLTDYCIACLASSSEHGYLSLNVFN